MHGISDMQAGNAYLPEFLEDFNRRFAVVPRSNHDAHRPLLKIDHLDVILIHQETRTISKNLTVQFKHVVYLWFFQEWQFAESNREKASATCPS